MAWIAPLAAHGPGVLEACVKRSNGDLRLVHPGDTLPPQREAREVERRRAGRSGRAGGASRSAGSPVTGPPYVWICTPAHYPLAGSNTIPGSSPAETYPGETGSATVTVPSASTRNVTWVMPQTVPDAITSVAFTVRVVSDQPIAVGSRATAPTGSTSPATTTAPRSTTRR